MRAKAFWLILVALGLGTKRHWHILVAILLGVLLGISFPYPNMLNQPDKYYLIHQFFDVVGQLFIRLITMIVVPLVVSSLIVGVSSLGDSRQLGRMGGKVLFYFLLLMSISALLGAGLALWFNPGAQLQQNFLANADTASIIRELQQVPNQDLQAMFFNMIPRNPIESLAKADLVPVIFFTLLFGAAVASIGEAGKPIINFFESLFTATMKLTDWVMVLAVPGVFSLAFITVAKSGLGVFGQLWIYAVVILLGLLIQLFVIFPLMLKFLARINFMNVYRAISEAIMVAFGTASSSATLPITIACMERRAGVSNRIASFVLPTGATINKTATTMFEVIAVIFLMQAYHIPITPDKVGIIVLFSIIASIGAAGVPSAGLITIAIVLNSIGHYEMDYLAGGIAMLWSIDRVLDMCRTVVNVVSSCTVATLVASSEGELNRDILNNHDAWTEVV
ncbi:dicarboxylate/amino acid:cation symporter [Vampirovibrio sp.]|uniref:dicarboxylate/amino acid:cation symporter n=1 Tax=Vampirovibrio sp. TaxID=2717857 RepID=UPI0035939399